MEGHVAKALRADRRWFDLAAEVAFYRAIELELNDGPQGAYDAWLVAPAGVVHDAPAGDAYVVDRAGGSE